MALASTLAKYQDIVQLTDIVERADKEFGQDLWLIAERIILHRITRAADGKQELNSIFQVIQNIMSEAEHITNPLENDNQRGSLAFHTFESSSSSSSFSIVSGFSLVVDMVESLDSAELYRLIAWLRNEVNLNEETK